jgi:hypothetical protein
MVECHCVAGAGEEIPQVIKLPALIAENIV